MRFPIPQNHHSALPRIQTVLLPLFIFLVVLGGCSRGDRPPLGNVCGVVTLDGDLLEGAGVMFKAEGRRSSFGVTDSSGHYELEYLRDIKGAVFGVHKVTIDVMPKSEERRSRKLPKHYNRKSTLVAEVQQGKNVFNWELTSN